MSATCERDACRDRTPAQLLRRRQARREAAGRSYWYSGQAADSRRASRRIHRSGGGFAGQAARLAAHGHGGSRHGGCRPCPELDLGSLERSRGDASDAAENGSGHGRQQELLTEM